MHDESIERRLRGALHEEADALPFTITAAELERRLALRRRSFAGRRLTLLLAAAVGISLFGVGGALNGWFNATLPTRTQTAVTTSEPPGPSDAVVTELPSLDELVAADPATVVLAQAHGPTDVFGGIPETELTDPFVSLGTLEHPGTYTLTAACLHGTTLEFVFPPHVAGGIPRVSIPCDGRPHDAEVEVSQPQDAGMTADAGTAWRFVIRGTTPPPEPQPIGVIPMASEDQEELVRWDAAPLEPGAQPWGSGGLVIQQVGIVPPRQGYYARLQCAAGAPIRLIFGDVVHGAIVPRTESVMACDPRRIRDMTLLTAQPAGLEVYLAAPADQPVSLLVTSPTPPVSLAQNVPGWRISGGIGPDLAFETHGVSFSGAGVGEDHVQVALACTGTDVIEVSVEDGITQTFSATCLPEGNTTIRLLHVTEQGVAVRYVAPKGAWTALTILVPSK
jgi:hypothetical protein